MDVSSYPEVVNQTKQLMSKLDLNLYPAILNYIKHLSERPAFQKSIGMRYASGQGEGVMGGQKED